MLTEIIDINKMSPSYILSSSTFQINSLPWSKLLRNANITLSWASTVLIMKSWDCSPGSEDARLFKCFQAPLTFTFHLKLINHLQPFIISLMHPSSSATAIHCPLSLSLLIISTCPEPLKILRYIHCQCTPSCLEGFYQLHWYKLPKRRIKRGEGRRQVK